MKTIAVIGLGSIGMRHAKNLKAMGHNVVGLDPKVLVGDGFPVVWPFSFDRLKDHDAIIIASPTDNHLQDIHGAYNLNSIGVFVEKPIAHKMDADIDWVNMVGYNLRFHGCVKKAKEWLDAGLIGRPLWANFTLGQWSDKPPYLRDGVILNWSHEIDLCLYLLGSASVSGSSTRITRWLPDPMTKIAHENDDITDILLRHETGCMSTVHLDYVTKPEHRYFKIVGTEKVITAYLSPKRSIKIGTSIDNDEWFHGTDTWNDNYIEEMQAFLDRCDGKETIGCSGSEGLEVLKICLEVRRQAGLP